MTYVNDVFISYKRDPFENEWLVEHFMPMFLYFVREEITAACGRLRAHSAFVYQEAQSGRIEGLLQARRPVR
jgi:hypothetical protein